MAGLDLDRREAEDLPCRPDHAFGREDLVVSRVDERGRDGGRALELEFTVIRVRPELRRGPACSGRVEPCVEHLQRVLGVENVAALIVVPNEGLESGLESDRAFLGSSEPVCWA